VTEQDRPEPVQIHRNRMRQGCEQIDMGPGELRRDPDIDGKRLDISRSATLGNRDEVTVGVAPNEQRLIPQTPQTVEDFSRLRARGMVPRNDNEVRVVNIRFGQHSVQRGKYPCCRPRR
jgi:hypothetical protein